MKKTVLIISTILLTVCSLTSCDLFSSDCDGCGGAGIDPDTKSNTELDYTDTLANLKTDTTTKNLINTDTILEDSKPIDSLINQ